MAKKGTKDDARPVQRRRASERATGIIIRACTCKYGCGGVNISLHDKENREISYIKLHHGEDVDNIMSFLNTEASIARERELSPPENVRFVN